MNIKEDKELKFAIDKLIDYYNEIEEEIINLKESKKELEKIIKSYIFKTQDLEEKPKHQTIYEHNHFHVSLNRKYSSSILSKMKKLRIEELIDNKDYKNIEIKKSVELIKTMISSIDEEIDFNIKIQKQEILAKYLNYINSIENSNIIDNYKIGLINYFIKSENSYLKYIQIKNLNSHKSSDMIVQHINNKDIKEKDYKIEIRKK